MDINKLMKEARKMQEELQNKLSELKVEGSAGGGMVTVIMDGAKNVIDIKISEEIFQENDVEMLQDLILAALQDASAKVEEESKNLIASFGLPPGLF